MSADLCLSPGLSPGPSCAMDLRGAIGACLPVFVLAVIFDVTGIILLFLGIFANLRLDGLFYGDFLIYTGSIILFFSLGLWLMWYLGNVPAPYDPLRRKSSGLAELARSLSRKLSRGLSHKLKAEVKREEAEEDGHGEDGKGHAGKTGRVTWGKSTAYVNDGYEHEDGGKGGEEEEEVKKREVTENEEDVKDIKDVKAQKEDEPPEESVDGAVDTQETSFHL